MQKSLHGREILEAFRRFALLERGSQRTMEIIEALQSDARILPLLKKPTSFSALFASFSLTEDFGSLRPKMATFSRLAGIIESIVRPCEARNEEPQEFEKQFLLPLLSRFISTLPSSEELERWLETCAADAPTAQEHS